LTPEIETQLRRLHNLKLSQLIHYIIDAPDLICDQ